MSESNNLTSYQRNRDIILSKANDYYKNNNERLKKHAKDKCRSLSEENKKKKRELKEYQKRKYQEAKESKHNNE